MMGFVEYINRPAPFPLSVSFLIASLYGNGEQGAFYIPRPTVLDQQVLYQDAAGTTPVTAPGDPVGLMLDLSGNDNHATQAVSGSRPVYRTDGTRHWLEFDGVDDFMGTTLEGVGLDTFQGAFWCAYRATADSGSGYVAQDGTESGSTSNHGFSVIAPSQTTLNRIVLGGAASNTTAHQTGADRVLAAAWDRTSNEGQYGWDGSRNAADVGGESYGGALLIGKRGGSSPPHFTGRIYGLTVRSALTDDTLLAQVESYFANLAGVTLND